MKERITQEGWLSLNRLFDNPDASVTEQQLQEKLDAILAVLEPRKVTEADIRAGAEKLKQLFRERFQDE